MPNLPSNDDLDALVDELFTRLGTERSGEDFFFDPESITGSTRTYYVDFLNWLGIDDSVLPAERICIHDGRDRPANLDRRRGGDGEGYTLFIDNSLYRTLEAVYAALAHQFAHLKLIIDEDHSLAEAENCRPYELEKPKSKKSDDDDDDDDDVETDEDSDDAEAKLAKAKAAKAEAAAELEVRAEVAAFVLGFGKLVLNGACEWDELDIDDDEGFEHITTLPVKSLVHLYKKVAKHADVGSEDLEAGLTDEAKEALGSVKSKNKKK